MIWLLTLGDATKDRERCGGHNSEDGSCDRLPQRRPSWTSRKACFHRPGSWRFVFAASSVPGRFDHSSLYPRPRLVAATTKTGVSSEGETGTVLSVSRTSDEMVHPFHWATALLISLTTPVSTRQTAVNSRNETLPISGPTALDPPVVASTAFSLRCSCKERAGGCLRRETDGVCFVRAGECETLCACATDGLGYTCRASPEGCPAERVDRFCAATSSRHRTMRGMGCECVPSSEVRPGE